jgi:hypothetical protein
MLHRLSKHECSLFIFYIPFSLLNTFLKIVNCFFDIIIIIEKFDFERNAKSPKTILGLEQNASEILDIGKNLLSNKCALSTCMFPLEHLILITHALTY